MKEEAYYTYFPIVLGKVTAISNVSLFTLGGDGERQYSIKYDLAAIWHGRSLLT